MSSFVHSIPWEAPEGQQWLEGLLSKTSLLHELRTTLSQPVSTHHVQIRMAAWGIWILSLTDSKSLRLDDIDDAIDRLRQVLSLQLYETEYPEAASLVEQELSSLESVRKTYSRSR